MSTIKNWFLIGNRIFGNIYDDERFGDGEEVTTSSAISIDTTGDFLNEPTTAVTRGRSYRLESPDKNWLLGVVQDRIKSILDPIPKL